MTKDTSRLDWNHLQAFLTTVETGSLSAAARTLGLTQPTLSRQISALEQALSLMLFERAGKRLTLTDAGRELLHSAQEMGKAANNLALSAEGQRSDLSGLVRITASEIMSAYVLPDVIKELRLRAPQIRVEVVASDDIENLIQRDADIALRHVRPEQPDLVARLLCEHVGYFFADKGYLDSRGPPKSVEDLSQFDWIAMGDIDRMQAYLAAMGINLPRKVFRLNSQSTLVGWELAKSGLGICPMDAKIADHTPHMLRVLPKELTVTFPIWLVTHREIHTNPRIRLVFDLLAASIA